MAWYWILLIYWLVFFASTYFVLEQGQYYFYDEVTPGAPWKVALGTFILASLLTWRNPTTLDMFTSRIGETALLAIVGWVVYTLVLRFQPWHAAALGPVAVVLVAAVTALAVESLADSGRSLRRDPPASNRPIRKQAGGGIQALPVEEPPASPASAPAPLR